MGVSPYVQIEGFVEEGVQLVPLALGGPSHHLGELVPGLQGELDEGVAGAWWGAGVSPLPALPRHGVTGHTGVAGGIRAPSLPPPPALPALLGGCRSIPKPAHVWICHRWLQ